jgi:hypothetical protein
MSKFNLQLPQFDVSRFFLLRENVPGGNGTGVAFWDCFECSQALNALGFVGRGSSFSSKKATVVQHVDIISGHSL